MDSVQSVLAINIQNLRKSRDMTQEMLASALGVSYQAVSKWQTAKSCPDVALLPKIAGALGCSLDALFSGIEGASVLPSGFPWPDDDTVRVLLCRGHTILRAENGLLKEFTFRLSPETDVMNVESMCNIVLEDGSVRGNCKAGGSIRVSGSVSGACFAGHTVVAGGDIGGDCKAGHSIEGRNISGDCRAGHAINVSGDLHGTIRKAQKVTVGGKIVKDCEEVPVDEKE